LGREPAIGSLGLAACAPLATATLAGTAALIGTVADQNRNPAITGGVLGLFGGDAFAFTDRRNGCNGGRYDSVTGPAKTDGGTIAGPPSYVVASEYISCISTRNNTCNVVSNCRVVNFKLNVKIGGNVRQGVTL